MDAVHVTVVSVLGRANAGPLLERLPVVSLQAEVVEVVPGCVCCAVRLDVVDALWAVLRRRVVPRSVALVVEAHEDPLVVVQTILGDPDLRRAVIIDAVVAVIDGPQAVVHLADSDAVAIADVVVIVGAELLTPAGRSAVRGAARSRNPVAVMVTDDDLSIVLGSLRGHRSFDLAATPARLERVRCRFDHASSPLRHARSLLVHVEGELDPAALDAWIAELHERSGADLLRLHGVMAVEGEPNLWCLHGVRTTLEVADGAARLPDRNDIDLWVVGRGFDGAELQRSLQRCVVE